VHHVPEVIVGVYSLLVLFGGYMGYKKKGSKPSLIAGTASAVLLDISVVLMYVGMGWGIYIAGVTALFLLGFFAVRYARSPDRAFMPAGLMSILSILTLVGLFLTRHA
jgi:uncharacterized membrane protein (UPF0136 family)